MIRFNITITTRGNNNSNVKKSGGKIKLSKFIADDDFQTHNNSGSNDGL